MMAMVVYLITTIIMFFYNAMLKRYNKSRHLLYLEKKLHIQRNLQSLGNLKIKHCSKDYPHI